MLTEFKWAVQNRAHDKYLDSLKNMSSEEQKQALLKFKEDYKLVYSIKICERIDSMLRELEDDSFFDPDKHERHPQVLQIPTLKKGDEYYVPEIKS